MSFAKYANSSIGKKQIMAVTGFLLILFLLGHLAGNFFVFAGYGSYNHEQAKILEAAPEETKAELKKTKEAQNTSVLPQGFDPSAITDIKEIPINKYAQKLRDLGPLLWVARIVLLVAFVVHIRLAFKTIFINKAARPQKYAMVTPKRDVGFSEITMRYTGLIILLYVFLHLADLTFKVTPVSSVLDGVDEGLYGHIINGFSNPMHCGVYIFAMLAVGLHITHGLQSACQTFGINHPRYTPTIKKISVLAGAVIALGFISIPVFVFINHGLN